MANETFELASFAAGLTHSTIPAAVVERAKLLVLDTVGVALGGRATVPSIGVMADALGALGWSGTATVFGDRRGWSSAAAAMTNASLAHGMDFDDTHRIGLHPTVVLLPAALAAAEMEAADGKTVLRGLVAGYEVMCRIAASIIPAHHYERGFHPTATVGVFGAAVAAGVVLGLDAERIEHALGLCGSQAAGSSQFIVSGGWNKHFHVGAAAMNGLIAATFARAGYQGARHALEGERGFLCGYGDGADAAELTRGLGRTWQTLEIAVKPYPCCRHSHAAIDGLLALRQEHDLHVDEIVAVRIGISTAGVAAVGLPEAAKRRSRTTVEAQFSLPFVAACALRDGHMRWEHYQLAPTGQLDPLCDRISVFESQRANEDFPERLSAEIEIETGRGSFRRFVAMPLGEPATFPDKPAALEKFLPLAGMTLTPARSIELAQALLDLDRVARIADLMRLTRPDA